MNGQKGQTLVLVALMLVAMLGMAALALDGSNLYLQRRQAQTAADAGALAASRARCLGQANWQTVGNDYCNLNQAADGLTRGCTTVAGAGPYSARTTASVVVPGWFSQVIGVSNVSVGALAAADCGAIAGTGNLIPMTIPVEDYAIGSFYTVWNKEEGENGSFGWLQWRDPLDVGCPRSQGNDRLRDCIVNPWCAPEVRIGEVINTETGNKNSALEDALWPEWRCQIVTIPIYGSATGTGNNRRYTIVAFGAFLLTGMCKNRNESAACPGYTAPVCSGGDTKVTGRFVGYVNPDSWVGGPDYGVYTVYLSE